MKYVKEDLFGDIFNGRSSEESKKELLQASPEYAERIKELVKIKTTTAQALEIFSTL